MRIVPLLVISMFVGVGAALVDRPESAYRPSKPITAQNILHGSNPENMFELATRNALAASHSVSVQ